MSIESTLEELVSAVRELTTAVKAASLSAPSRAQASTEASPKAEGKPAKVKEPSASAPAAADSQRIAVEKAPEPAAQPEKAENSDKPLVFDTDVAPLFRQYVGKAGRDEAKAFIASYSPTAAKLSDAIKPEQYAEVVAKLKDLLS